MTDLTLFNHNTPVTCGTLQHCKSVAREIARSNDQPKRFVIADDTGAEVQSCDYTRGRLEWKEPAR